MGRRMAQAGTPCTLMCMKFQPMPRERSRRRIDDTMGKLAHCRAERPNGTSCWLASMMTVSRHPNRCGSVLRVGMRFACPFIAPKLGGHLTDLPHAGTPMYGTYTYGTYGYIRYIRVHTCTAGIRSLNQVDDHGTKIVLAVHNEIVVL